MKSRGIGLPFILILCIALLTACGIQTANTIIEMEMRKDYDTSDPFIHEKLIYVSDDIDSLQLNVSFQMKGESGTLEIANNQTKEVFWSDSWNENVDESIFTISLDTLKKDAEYVIRFTGAGINYAKIVITSENSLVKEREQPVKPRKD